MSNGGRVPEALQWSEGMLLAPQHFQQNDIYWHALLAHQMAQLEPYYWGIFDLKLDNDALRAGNVRVLSLHAVMPDGLVVQYPAPGQDDALVLDVSADAVARENRPLTVHVVVPVRTEGAASRASSIQRYDSVAGALELDENTGEARIEVGRLRPRLGLLAGDRIPAKYVAMPLLQLRRDLGGHFDLTDYHPPLLRIGASRFLGDAALAAQLELLATRIRAKAKELLGIVDGETPVANGSAAQHRVVRRLVTALPAFEVLVRSGAAHPFALYVALAQLLGQMAGIAADPIPMLLDTYRHDNVAPGFYKALRHVNTVLARLNAAYEAIVFERKADDLFVTALGSQVRSERLIVELKPAQGQTPQALAQWLNRACIGAAPMMPLLRQRRLPGARVRALTPGQVPGLNAGSGLLYEIVNQPIEQDGKLVPVIQPGVPMHVQGAADATAPAAIVLYLPNGNGKNAAVAPRAVANG
ncbi:MAG: type VI secretion system baseplate subunit TssK [Sulfurifustaceae bacterium]